MVADMAQAISDACLGPWQWGEWGGGQQFNSLGFNVVVLAQAC